MSHVGAWRTVSGILVALACACTHGEPYVIGEPAIDNQPVIDVSGTTRLTFGADGDWAAGWLPDGASIAFSWRLADRANGDRCLALLGIPGYRIRRTLCIGGGADSTNVVVSSAVSNGGRLALVAETSPLNLPLRHRTLYLASAYDRFVPRPVLTLPITTTGLLHPSMEQLVWRGESTLVYVATAPRNIRSDLQSSPLEIGVVTLHGDTAVTSVVPGTAGASSVTIDPVFGHAYATFVNDPRVYRIDLATGIRQGILDLSAYGVPRDLRVVSGHLAAVVRGRLFPVPAAAYGVATDLDEGGEMVFADLIAGTAPVLYQKSFVWFRRPTISPDGKSIVVEEYPVAYPLIPPIGQFPPLEDTIVTKISDLWLIPWP